MDELTTIDELTLLDMIGCEGGFWTCTLERWGGDVAAFTLLMGFLLGCAGIVWTLWSRGGAEDVVRQTRRPLRRPRVVRGPELHDGSWVRLVEPAPGHLRVEIWVDRTWIPVHRHPARFFDAAARHPEQLPRR